MNPAAWEWLDAREPEIPEALRARMRDAVWQTEKDGIDVATHLADAALLCLRASLAIGDHRDAALDLLAADALLTHAAEAAVESGTIEAFAQRHDAIALSRLCAPDAT